MVKKFAADAMRSVFRGRCIRGYSAILRHYLEHDCSCPDFLAVNLTDEEAYFATDTLLLFDEGACVAHVHFGVDKKIRTFEIMTTKGKKRLSTSGVTHELISLDQVKDAMAQAIVVKESQHLDQVNKEKRTRKNTVWIIHDVKSSHLLLSQKLEHLTNYINLRLATLKTEKVTSAGLYEASDTAGNRVDGYHKMRYRVMSCPIKFAPSKFNQMRYHSGVGTAVILTGAPQNYVFGNYSATVQTAESVI